MSIASVLASALGRIRTLTSHATEDYVSGLAAAATILALANSPAVAQQAAPAPLPVSAEATNAAATQLPTPGKPYYLMFRNIVDRSKLPGAAPAHARWIATLQNSGRIFVSGPTFAADGGPGVGITVFRAADFDEATALAASDPFVQSGVATFEIKRWQLN